MIVKDLLLLARDRGTLISLFLLPIVFIAGFGAMFRSGPTKERPQEIALAYTDGDARGAAIARTLEAMPGFAVTPSPSAEAARADVVAQRVVAAVIVAPEPAAIEIAIDSALPVQVRGPVEGALRGVITFALGPPSTPPPIEVRSPPALARPQVLSAFQVTVPGNAVLFGFFIAMTVAMAFAHDRRSGTWRRRLAAPIPRGYALLASLVPYAGISLVQSAFLIGIGIGVFGMQIAGSPLALAAISVAIAYCAVALGLLLAAIGGSERQLGAIGSVLLLVMGLLGGCMFPRISMSSTMQTLGLGVPHGWALDAYQTILLRSGSGVGDIAGQLAALLGFGTAFAAAGVALFRFER